jgi:hypothetical protein
MSKKTKPPRGFVERGGIGWHSDYSGQGPGGSTPRRRRFRWVPGLALEAVAQYMEVPRFGLKER